MAEVKVVGQFTIKSECGMPFSCCDDDKVPSLLVGVQFKPFLSLIYV
jgi:hypothetical protein